MTPLDKGREQLTPHEKRQLLTRLLNKKADAGRDHIEPRNGAPAWSVAPEAEGVTSTDRLVIELEELSITSEYGRYVNPYLGHVLSALKMDQEFVTGEGCYLFDAGGQRYLDFIAQYGAVPFGFNPPEIWEAIAEVRAKRRPSFVQPSSLSAAGRLARRLVEAAPDGLGHVTFANSGAEAIEIAIKLCRSATGRRGILSTRNSFHGKTLGAVSVTGNAFYQRRFGVPLPDFDHVPYGDVSALERALSATHGHYAAFIIEPIQGEGGIVEPPPGYLARAKEICRQHGTAFVLDEIQTGLGRTGRLFACQAEGVVPDVMALAKALGGGLVPLGACLSSASIFNPDFALRHSSTFAGGTLACEVGLATLDLLEREGGRLVRQVAERGALLKQELSRLKSLYPGVVREIRGRGYMLGLRLDQEQLAARDSVVGFFAQQGFLTYLVTSYLLNVGHVRVAPTASASDVLRIEPPLVADGEHARLFIEALEHTLQVVEQDDGARLLRHLTGRTCPARTTAPAARSRPRSGRARAEIEAAPENRFAFLIHLGEGHHFASFDPGVEAFSDEEIEALGDRLSPLFAPFVGGSVSVRSRIGRTAVGEVIVVPYTARRLMELSPQVALAKVERATAFALARGARIVGLGGYNSIVTQGGLSLRDRGYGTLTSGNSYTVTAGLKAIRAASARRGLELAASSVAIVGATGALGRAMTRLLAEEVQSLILLGNPKHEAWALKRMRHVVGELLSTVASHGSKEASPESLATRVRAQAARATPAGASAADELVRTLEKEGRILLSTKASEALGAADVVVTATSAVETFIGSDDLKRGAIICELSRPFNVSSEARRARPDVLFIDGGLVRAPADSVIDVELDLPPGVVFACLAETMLLALEGARQSASLGWELDLPTIRYLDTLGEQHGFEPII